MHRLSQSRARCREAKSLAASSLAGFRRWANAVEPDARLDAQPDVGPRHGSPKIYTLVRAGPRRLSLEPLASANLRGLAALSYTTRVNTERRIAIFEACLARHLAWIGAADAKAGFIFAASTAMLGLLAAAAPKYGSWSALGVALAILSVSFLMISLVGVSAAVFPRSSGPKLSVIFFGGVAGRPIDEYRKDLIALDEEAYLEDLIEQCHINAEIASTKYAWVKRSSVALYVALPLWVAAAYILFRDR